MSSFQARALHIASPLDAERELRTINVDSGGIAMMATKMLTRCIKLHGLQCRQANILKQEMLALGGDAAVARGTVACSIDTTDVILIGTDKQLRKLCNKLAPQPFGLPALAMELSAVLAHTSSVPAVWRTARRNLQLTRPLIMGILNVTPDSFSDGARYLDQQRAVEHAQTMLSEGADIIVPVISEIANKTGCVISVDTWKSAVAREAMAAGAEIINDISGFTFDANLATVASETGAGVVLMHTRGAPDTMQRDTGYTDLIGEIMQGLRKSVETALAAGMERERIAIDPGIGFGKNSSGNLEILGRLREFTALGLPLLVGASRKSFIGAITGREINDRLFGTAATVALAVSNGASILRVHDVAAMRDVVDMAHAINMVYQA